MSRRRYRDAIDSNKKDVEGPPAQDLLKEAYDQGIADGQIAILHKNRNNLPPDQRKWDSELQTKVVNIPLTEVRGLVCRAFQQGYASGEKSQEGSPTSSVQQTEPSVVLVEPSNTGTGLLQETSYATKWVKMYETNSKGKVIFGQMISLVEAVNNACTIRIIVPEWRQVFSVQNAKTYGSRVCAQSLFNITKAKWNTFSDTPAWQFIYFNSSGNFHRAEYLLGSHSRPADPDTRGRVGISWFVRYQEKPFHIPEHNQVYCNSSDGEATEGSLKDLVSAVQQGADIRFTTGGDYMVPSVNSISLDGDDHELVIAQSLWHVATRHVQMNAEFQNNAYWWFTMFGTDGRREMSRWSVGEHVNKGHTNDQQDVCWFVDKHWSLAYKHSSTGEPIEGSHDQLIAAVIAGKRVRLLLNDNYAVEVDNLLVNRGYVSAQLLGNICRDGVGKFWDDEAYWIWHIISSEGKSDCTQLRVGCTSQAGSFSGAAPRLTAWYVDDRPYRNVLTISSGKIIAGSKQELTKELTSGSMLQLVIHYPDGSVLTFTPDNIQFHQDDVAAQFIRHVGYQDSGDGFRKFTTTQYWHLIIVTTQGSLVSSKWVVGEHEFIGENHGNEFREDVDIHWFVN